VRRQLVFILSMTLITRLVYFPFPPSDDMNRYIWEGYPQAPDQRYLAGH
jgi:hypothetical protein